MLNPTREIAMSFLINSMKIFEPLLDLQDNQFKSANSHGIKTLPR